MIQLSIIARSLNWFSNEVIWENVLWLIWRVKLSDKGSIYKTSTELWFCKWNGIVILTSCACPFKCQYKVDNILNISQWHYIYIVNFITIISSLYNPTTYSDIIFIKLWIIINIYICHLSLFHMTNIVFILNYYYMLCVCHYVNDIHDII